MSDNKKESNFKWIVYVSIGFLILFNIIYIIQTGGCLSTNASDFAAYGSYIGGALGSVLSFITVIILVITLKKQNEANVANIKLLTKQLNEQKTNHKENIGVLENQIEEEKKNNDTNIKLLKKQININTDNYERSFKYNLILNQIARIVTILDKEINPSIFYDFLITNRELFKKTKYNKFITLSSEKYAKEYNKYSITLIHVLKDCMIFKYVLNQLKLPSDIKRDTHNLITSITNLVHLVSQYFDHEISHAVLYITINDVFEPNNILQKIGAYELFNIHGIYNYIEDIKNDNLKLTKAKITRSNYRELKEWAFIEMTKNNTDNINTKGITFLEFIELYNVIQDNDVNKYVILSKENGCVIARAEMKEKTN